MIRAPAGAEKNIRSAAEDKEINRIADKKGKNWNFIKIKTGMASVSYGKDSGIIKTGRYRDRGTAFRGLSSVFHPDDIKDVGT